MFGVGFLGNGEGFEDAAEGGDCPALLWGSFGHRDPRETQNSWIIPKDGKGLEDPQEERMRAHGMFSRRGGKSIGIWSSGLCSLVTGSRERLEPCQGRFRLDIGKRFLIQRVLGHWNSSPGNGHIPKAARAPGMFGQRFHGQGGIVGIVLSREGVGSMIPVGPVPLRIFQDSLTESQVISSRCLWEAVWEFRPGQGLSQGLRGEDPALQPRGSSRSLGVSSQHGRTNSWFSYG
ncbi:hypothetical protein DUI87_22108 [Hirundo rustica rustica]|uniref:Uncharacterized protein n=1 Tax=Hirundo rustica rustica TaxID=333673 RepID=A0A3M0JKG1_HIRRU|nr:hypothetical protein DUI87_22108 [Hirundo rustica rustica]